MEQSSSSSLVYNKKRQKRDAMTMQTWHSILPVRFHHIFLTAMLLFVLATLFLFEIVSETLDNNDYEDIGVKVRPDTGIHPGFMDKKKRRQKRSHEYTEKINLHNIGDKSEKYAKIREIYDKRYPPDDIERLKKTANSVLRKRDYLPINGEIDCPDFPPENYPQHYSIMDVIKNWPTDDTTPRENIYQGICVFDHATELHKAFNYRNAEVPFVIRDDPAILRPAERWADPEYLLRLLPDDIKQRAEYSESNHFMYWNKPKPKYSRNPSNKDWKSPTEMIRMTYSDWLQKAKMPDEVLGIDKPHWYFR